MAEIVNLTITIDTRGAALSLRSVLDKIALIGNRLEFSIDLLDQLVPSGDDGGDLFVCEPIDLPAGGTDQVQGLQLLPGDRYRKLVSALADKVECDVVFSHGWPVLSLVSGDSSVADGAGATSARPQAGESAWRTFDSLDCAMSTRRLESGDFLVKLTAGAVSMRVTLPSEQVAFLFDLTRSSEVESAA